jgi:hypothetical protein
MIDLIDKGRDASLRVADELCPKVDHLAGVEPLRMNAAANPPPRF